MGLLESAARLAGEVSGLFQYAATPAIIVMVLAALVGFGAGRMLSRR